MPQSKEHTTNKVVLSPLEPTVTGVALGEKSHLSVDGVEIQNVQDFKFELRRDGFAEVTIKFIARCEVQSFEKWPEEK